MTIFEEYELRAAAKSDINEHLPALRALARRCEMIAEFGVRTGNSTIALLCGLADTGRGVLHSYDISPAHVLPPFTVGVQWRFTQANTATLPTLPYVEMLFIDTLHTCDQVRAELLHAERVRDYLVFHDTVLFGWSEETVKGGPPGINRAIFEFLLTEQGMQWRVKSHNPVNNGLLVLERVGALPS